jgi:hypothetical protein
MRDRSIRGAAAAADATTTKSTHNDAPEYE